jgi:hypothetical protein
MSFVDRCFRISNSPRRGAGGVVPPWRDLGVDGEQSHWKPGFLLVLEAVERYVPCRDPEPSEGGS